MGGGGGIHVSQLCRVTQSPPAAPNGHPSRMRGQSCRCSCRGSGGTATPACTVRRRQALTVRVHGFVVHVWVFVVRVGPRVAGHGACGVADGGDLQGASGPASAQEAGCEQEVQARVCTCVCVVVVLGGGGGALPGPWATSAAALVCRVRCDPRGPSQGWRGRRGRRVRPRPTHAFNQTEATKSTVQADQ